MGMYDDIVVKVPLPDGETINEFQTKSLDCFLEDYEIREDGTLWHEEYDVEDQSDPTATGLSRFAGIATRVNKRWVQVTDFTGEIEFHGWDADAKVAYRYSTYFVDGQLQVGPIRMLDKRQTTD